MILVFPDLDVYSLAITSGTIPLEIQATTINVSFIDDCMHVESDSTLSRQCIKELRQLGVQRSRRKLQEGQAYDCWHQAIPLQPTNSAITEQTPVLFDVAAAELPSLINEILRLGNDRLSYRHFAHSTGERALLRVVGPPFYSLLRAKDQAFGEIAAFQEQQSRLWVQLGNMHPLGERITAPPGYILLLQSPNQWHSLAEQPFRDVYDALEFQLNEPIRELQSIELDSQVKVPLRLLRSNTDIEPEMWVVRDRALEQLEALVMNSPQALLARYAFAVIDRQDGPTAVVRARQGKTAPPPLVLDAIAYRHYLRIPNLYVPVDRRVHPPLRRDALQRLLAPDEHRLYWLHPIEDGQFQTESVSDASFRPLSDWVDYVLDRDIDSLTTWIQSHQFDFDSFKVELDLQPREASNKPGKKGSKANSSSAPPSVQTHFPDATQTVEPEETLRELPPVDLVPTDAIHDQLGNRLRELETQFTELDDEPDSDARRVLWESMAVINARLSRRHDMTICWTNALWYVISARDVQQLAQQWFACELRCSSFDSFGRSEIKRMERDPSQLSGSLVAAYLVSTAASQTEALNLRELASLLTQSEERLPVRAIWIAWQAVSVHAQGDYLALARARDRILARLYDHGLSAEFDLAPFMRSGTSVDDFRIEQLSRGVSLLHDQVQSWIQEPTATATGANPRTKCYAQLMFSFAFSGLAEAARGRELMTAAHDELTATDDEIHHWIASAFQFRIEQGLQGQRTESLPQELRAALDEMDRNSRYKLDRLRGRSRILEPHQSVDEFYRWHNKGDELDALLLRLQQLDDAGELRANLTAELNKEHDPVDQTQIAIYGLEFAPRIGESFVSDVLAARIADLLSGDSPAVLRAELLSRAVFVAGHFGLVELAQSFVSSFQQIVPPLISEFIAIGERPGPDERSSIEAVEELFTDSLRRLRRLGLREEISQLLTLAESCLTSAVKNERQSPTITTRILGLRLAVASARGFLGDAQVASTVCDEAREILHEADLPVSDQLSLAQAYIKAASLAPVDEALQRIQELFTVDERKNRQMVDISDKMFTNSHYSITQLTLIESVVLALVSDDLTLDAETRRWLDADEFHVRRRIRVDLQTP